VTKLGVSRKNILSSKTWEMKVNDIKTQQTAYVAINGNKLVTSVFKKLTDPIAILYFPIP
jgi:hypothetical protein